MLSLLQVEDIVSGLFGEHVTDHAEEGLRCEPEFVTGPLPVGTETCVIH